MKNKSIFLAVLLLIGSYGRAQNYFSETRGINKFVSLIKIIQPDGAAYVKVANGQIVVDSPLLVKLKKIASDVMNIGTSQDDQFLNNGGSRRATVPPPTGEISTNPSNGGAPPQNPNGNRQPSAFAVQVASALKANDNDVLKELKALSFLAFDTRDADYKAIKGSFPKGFNYLDMITTQLQQYALLGAAPINADMQAAAFTGFSFADLGSNLAYGIADWAIKQAKEELMDVYLDRWYQKLKSDTIIGPLIPQSLKVYEAFKQDQSLSLAKYGDKWKAAFQEDIRNIPVVFQDEDYVKKVLNKLKINDEELKRQLTPVIAGGDELVYNLYLKKNLVDQLAAMASRYDADTDVDLPVFKRCVLMADLLATICGHKEGENYVMPSPEELKKLDLDSWKMVIKLVTLRNNIVLDKVFNTGAADFLITIALGNDNSYWGKLSANVQQTVNILIAYQRMLSDLPPGNQVSLDDVRKMFDLSTQLFDNVSTYFDLTNDAKLKTLSADYKAKVKPFLTYLSEIGEGVSTTQFGKILDGAISIIRQADSLINPKHPLSTQTLADLQLYGSFMVNILSAKNSGEVEAAIEELIPRGQYQLKAKKVFSISLSLYPGAFGGQESIRKYHTDISGNIDYAQSKYTSKSMSLSFYLPIGLDFNLGRQTKKSSNDDPRYVTHSLFLQVFDLGAILNYRLTQSSDTTEKSDPNVNWKQLVSPGLNYMFHFVNSPVVVGMGVNYTPELRTVSQKGNTYQANAFRFGVFAAVDVTGLFLHLSRKTPKARK